MSEKKLYWHNVVGATSEELIQAEKDCEREFGDILYLPRHTSMNHRPMTMEQRSAQFLPFSALSGYDEEIEEAARRTQRRILLSEAEKQELDLMLQELKQNRFQDEIVMTYFVKDSKKSGGEYLEYRGRIHLIEETQRIVITEERQKISMDDIFAIRKDNQNI